MAMVVVGGVQELLVIGLLAKDCDFHSMALHFTYPTVVIREEPRSSSVENQTGLKTCNPSETARLGGECLVEPPSHVRNSTEKE